MPVIADPFDILIVGGGVVGCSTAYFLSAREEGRDLRIAVVEEDSTYARASTTLSVGGIRQQFSTPENIRIAQASADFLRQAPELLAVDGEKPELGFVEAGYLFLATPEGGEILRENHRLQVELGARVCLLEAQELGERFPWLRTDDLAAGTLGLEGEGWLDPYSLLRAFRAKARDQGVTFLDDRVVGLGVATGRVSFALLERLGPAPVGAVVNAAGPRARDVARMAGILDLPVESRKRFVYRFRCQEPVEGVPLTVDPSGVYFRPEGPEFLCGVSPPEAEDAETTDLEMDYGLFHDTIWPVLAHRVPAFQAIRLGFSWAGHYAVNTVDHNAILGPHPDVPNVYLANGFSGHGLQQSPAVGRALSELLLDGEYRTLDLSRMGFQRLAAGELLLERNVV